MKIEITYIRILKSECSIEHDESNYTKMCESKHTGQNKLETNLLEMFEWVYESEVCKRFRRT